MWTKSGGKGGRDAAKEKRNRFSFRFPFCAHIQYAGAGAVTGAIERESLLYCNFIFLLTYIFLMRTPLRSPPHRPCNGMHACATTDDDDDDGSCCYCAA